MQMAMIGLGRMGMNVAKTPEKYQTTEPKEVLVSERLREIAVMLRERFSSLQQKSARGLLLWAKNYLTEL